MTTAIQQSAISPLPTAPTPSSGQKTVVTDKSFVRTLETVEEGSASAAYSTRTATADLNEDQRIAQKSTDVPVTDDDFGFWDFIDLINPLQHIPLVGTLYREITGDTIKPEVQVAGGVLMGLATGNVLLSAATSIASAAFEQKEGQEPAIMMAQALWGEDKSINVPDPTDEPTIMVAGAEDTMPTEPFAPPPAAAPATPVEMMVAEAKDAAGTTHHTIATQETTPLVAAAALTPSQTEKTLGTLMQEQAAAHASGARPPPRLIEELMMQALDKYKTAHATAPLTTDDQAVVQ